MNTSTNNHNNTSGTTKTTNKSDGEQDVIKSDNSPEGTDEDTRAGALTSKAFSNNVNSASQYHNDNSEVEDDSEPNYSDAISNNQSDENHFSSSKSSIDVSFYHLHCNFKLILIILGGRYRSSKAESQKGGCKKAISRTKE